MTRMTKVFLMAALAGLLAVPLSAQQESLGDYARQVRKEKADEQPVPAARKFDNDNLPRNDKLSVVGPAPDQAADQSGAEQAAAASDDKDAAAQQEKAKAEGEWKDKLAAEKQQIDMLARDLDVTEREYRLRAAAFYADAGNRLRNAGAWDKQDASYKQQIAQKQKALDDAKKQLDDMEEQARKAGVPASER
ncbi:MAG TPA: hypothetical protein VLV49_13735 [Terriglobales bacterium]|nr:hypothetical protein [Terriglobales bacterium]